MSTQPGQPFALIGADHHLFLAGDSNDSLGQFTQRRTLAENSVKGWAKNFEVFAAAEAKYGFQGCCLIAPAKEEVFPDKYPEKRAGLTVIDDFMKGFKDKVVIPYWALRNVRDFAYSKTDTHWTDYGATMAALVTMDHWGYERPVSEAGLPQNFKIVRRVGDLGLKVHPYQSHYEMTFADDMAARIVFTNGVHNNGNITVYRNADAPVAGPLLIFGDSFGTNLAQAFSSVFQEVVYTYRPAALDEKLVAMVKPKHVILQITQRFVHGQPDLRKTIFEMAKQKISALSTKDRKKAIATIRKQPEIYGLRAASL